MQRMLMDSVRLIFQGATSHPVNRINKDKLTDGKLKSAELWSIPRGVKINAKGHVAVGRTGQKELSDSWDRSGNSDTLFSHSNGLSLVSKIGIRICLADTRQRN